MPEFSGGAGEGDKYFWNIKAEEEEEFKKINGRYIYEGLAMFFDGEDDDIFKNRTGDWSIKTKNGKDYSSLKMLSIKGKNFIIKTTKNMRLCTSSGEIYHSTNQYYSIEEITENLKGKNENIFSATKITKYISKEIIDTGAVVIVFNNRTRPEKIKLFNRILEVKDYVPKPRRCTNCQGFRHTKRWCEQPAVCARCAEAHETKTCTNSLIKKCVNCGGDHYASSWGCPKYKMEEKVEAIREKERLTYRQAAYKCEKNISPTGMSGSYASVAGAGIPVPSLTGAKENQPVTPNKPTDENIQKQIGQLQKTIETLSRTMEQQKDIIQVQSKLIWMVISRSMMSVEGEVGDCLKFLEGSLKHTDSSDSATDGEDSDDDVEARVFDDNKNSNKRKLRGSVTSQEDQRDKYRKSENSGNFTLSKRQRKQIKKTAKAAAKSAKNSEDRPAYYTADYSMEAKEGEPTNTD